MELSLRTITPRDAINLIRPLHVYKAVEILVNQEGIISQKNSL